MMPFTAGFSLLFGIPSILVLIGLLRIQSVVAEVKSGAPTLSSSSLRLQGAEVTVSDRVRDPVQQPTSDPVAQPPSPEVATPSVAPLGFGVYAMQEQEKSAPPSAEAITKPSFFDNVDWEQWVGQRLLQKVGILVVLIGMAVFLKYSFDVRLIDELGRLVLSLIAAGLLIFTGEWFKRKYVAWSHAFTGGGLALLYFTVWAAHVLYGAELLANYGFIVSPLLAMVLYSCITFVGAVMAVRHDAKTIGWFTLLGGYVTPLLISTVSPSPTGLAVYLAILAAGMLAMAWHRKWSGLSLASFALTQVYLFGVVYPSAAVSDPRQVLLAVGFFILFALPPLLYQFRLRRAAEPEDLCLILADGLAVFVAVVDGMGGFGGSYVGLVLLSLALVYAAFAGAAMRKRAEDTVLVNTYLLSAIGLTASALLAQMEWQWVAAGWGPFSVALVLLAMRLRRRCVLHVSLAILMGSLFFLVLNLPGDAATWTPFVSHWAKLSYVVFGSLVAWIALAERLPNDIRFSEEAQMHLLPSLHGAVAALLFVCVTFEATSLRWVVSLPLAMSYIGFSVIAIGAFMLTGMAVWLAAAFGSQMLVLWLTFLFDGGSGMVSPLLSGPVVSPFLHPWAGISLLSILAMAALLAAILRRQGHWANTITTRRILVFIGCAQVWTHVTVEIQHVQQAYALDAALYHRILTGWWVAFAALVLGRALWKRREYVLKCSLFALALPLVKDVLLMIAGRTDLYELSLWSVLALVVIGLATWRKEKMLLSAGIAMIAIVMAGDMLRSLSGDLLLFSIGWWTVIPTGLIAFGLSRREHSMLYVGMAMLGIIMFMDLLLRGPGSTATTWWTVVPLLLIAMGVLWKERALLFLAMGMLVAAIASDQSQVIAGGAGLLRTVWWDVVALAVMCIGFLKREKILRQFAICIFAGTVLKLLFIDFAMLSTGVRIAASILIGLLMIGASYLYQRFDASLVESRK